MPSPLASEFLAASGGAGDSPELEQAVAAAVAAARAEHPQIAVPQERFARHLGEKCRGAADAVHALSALAASDLYVAFAAAAGDRAGLSILDRAIQAAARKAAQVDSSAAFLEDVAQQLRERVLIPAERGGRARILDYSGSGSLLGWCRVVAVRVALNMKSAPRREVTLKSAILEDAGQTGGVESGALRHEQAQVLAQAFADAAALLDHEERVLLRYHFVDGLNFEEIAPIFGAHRSTISRRVEAARKKLLEALRPALEKRLGAAASEIAGLLQAAQSQLDVDLSAWLRTQG